MSKWCALASKHHAITQKYRANTRYCAIQSLKSATRSRFEFVNKTKFIGSFRYRVELVSREAEAHGLSQTLPVATQEKDHITPPKDPLQRLKRILDNFTPTSSAKNWKRSERMSLNRNNNFCERPKPCHNEDKKMDWQQGLRHADHVIAERLQLEQYQYFVPPFESTSGIHHAKASVYWCVQLKQMFLS